MLTVVASVYTDLVGVKPMLCKYIVYNGADIQVIDTYDIKDSQDVKYNKILPGFSSRLFNELVEYEDYIVSKKTKLGYKIINKNTGTMKEEIDVVLSQRYMQNKIRFRNAYYDHDELVINRYIVILQVLANAKYKVLLPNYVVKMVSKDDIITLLNQYEHKLANGEVDNSGSIKIIDCKKVKLSK